MLSADETKIPPRFGTPDTSEHTFSSRSSATLLYFWDTVKKNVELSPRLSIMGPSITLLLYHNHRVQILDNPSLHLSIYLSIYLVACRRFRSFAGVHHLCIARLSSLVFLVERIFVRHGAAFNGELQHLGLPVSCSAGTGGPDWLPTQCSLTQVFMCSLRQGWGLAWWLNGWTTG